MQRRRYVVWSVVVITIGLFVIMTGCTQSPENSPLIRKLMSDFTSLQEDMADMKDQVRRLSADMDAVTEEVTKLSQRSGGESAISAKEVEQLNSRIKQLQSKVSQLESSLASVRRGERTPTSTSPERAEQPAETVSSETESRERVEEETYTEPKGFYYIIQKGDTLSSIAKKFNVTQEAIRRENRIREDGTIYAGVRIFIPGKKPPE